MENGSPIHDMPIMIVESDAANRRLLEESLRKRHFKHIIMASSVQETLARMQETRPELFILDIIMPDMDGYTCCQAIRSDPDFYDVPILIHTGMTDADMRVRAFRCGATDFLGKPTHPDELYARVRVHLQNRHYVKDLRQYKLQMQAELDVARNLQQSILPQPDDIDWVQQHYALTIASHFRPSSEVGGDVWGVKPLNEQAVAVWNVDFSGHGVVAALNAFRFQSYLQEHHSLQTQPGEYMTHLNERLHRTLLPGQFATMFYGVIDYRHNRLRYACAFTPHPLLLSAGKQAGWLDGSGHPLGLGHHSYDNQEVEYGPGDTLVLYSDALVETPDSAGRMLDEVAWCQYAHEARDGSASVIMHYMLGKLREHADSALRDDLTLCVCKRV